MSTRHSLRENVTGNDNNNVEQRYQGTKKRGNGETITVRTCNASLFLFLYQLNLSLFPYYLLNTPGEKTAKETTLTPYSIFLVI